MPINPVLQNILPDPKEPVSLGLSDFNTTPNVNQQTQNNLLENKNFLPIQNFIIESVNEYCDQLKIDKSNLNLRPSYGWFNIYYRYDYQEFHIHGDSMISTIYFLNCKITLPTSVFPHRGKSPAPIVAIVESTSVFKAL